MTGPDVFVVLIVAALAFAAGWASRPHLPIGTARRHPAHARGRRIDHVRGEEHP